MRSRGEKRSGTVALLTVLLIILMVSLAAATIFYINLEDGQSGQTSSDTQSVTTTEASSEEETSGAPVESEISSEEASSETPSEDIIVDDDPLVNAHNTTKGSEEFPYYITVNRKQNIVIVYAMDEEGYYTVPYKAFVCSCGIPDEDGIVHTPTGTYNTMNQYTWRALNGGVYGQYATRIVGHILFHSVPYYGMDKSELEWDEYNKLGEAASEGCIRLTVEDAKWIYDNCPLGTTVTLYDSDRTEPFEKPTAAKIPEDSENRGWDPTDPDPENPWNS